MPLNNDTTGYPVFSFSAVLRGTLVSLVASVLGAAVLGVVFYFFSLSEKLLPSVATGVLFLSVFSGGMLAAQKAGNRGIYHGLAVSVAFFILSCFLIALFFPGHTIFMNVLQKLAVIGVAGGLGGVFGVGFSS